ncbi:hypothetical protein DB31_5977 [Hyalangium minutum]|uniref:Uncharacterized protein n=1 Tax=Hyalangium minutum TaxID=394096 RepID=A0A085VXE3_9BACT|nr:hypothetical protein DB31_5977 [Hyalangium minutum]
MSSSEPHEEETPVLGQDPDSPSPEFFAWAKSMTPTERMDVLRRFYDKWDPPTVPANGALAAHPTEPEEG